MITETKAQGFTLGDHLEITPGPGARPDDPVVIVVGVNARAWEIARRIERLLETGALAQRDQGDL